MTFPFSLVLIVNNLINATEIDQNQSKIFQYIGHIIDLMFNYAQLGEPMTDEVAYHVAIKFDIIRKLAVGLDFGNPCKLLLFYVHAV